MYERAIDEGSDQNAMYVLAILLSRGFGSVERDVVRAVPRYERTIYEVCYYGATKNLATLMNEGCDGIKRDVA